MQYGISTFNTAFWTTGKLWMRSENSPIPEGLIVVKDAVFQQADKLVHHYAWLPAYPMEYERYIQVGTL